jgi:hypothetical protein
MPDPALLAAAALAVAALAFLLALWLLLRVRRLGRAGAATAGDDALEHSDAERLAGLEAQLAMLAERLAASEAQGREAIQRIGVVRFNPFEDTGGNQSFALAVLDAAANGFVLSSLHSRQATRVYLKTVSGGHSDAALSNEEQLAIKRASG